MWTFQEQALASECVVHLGRQSISFFSLYPTELAEILGFLTGGEGLFTHISRFSVHMFCLRLDDFPGGNLDYRHRQNKLTAASMMLEMAFLLEAKHPIDKIYGLYSILTSYCNLPLPAPDYNKTAEQVYEKTVWAWIKTLGDLSILKLAARPGLVQKLPSWVPAWHQQHPSLIRNLGFSRHPVGNIHFTWNHDWTLDRWDPGRSLDISREIEDHVSVATVLSPGKLRVLHARFVGKVSHAIGPDRSRGVDWYYSSIQCLYVHLDWCKLIHDVFLHSHAAHEEALHEMYRSLQPLTVPHQLTANGGIMMKDFESFRAWFDFMLYLSEASGFPTLISGRTDKELSRESGVQLYFDICMADQEGDATDVLERGYGGDIQGREGLIKLARHIRSTKYGLFYLRNHSLCIVDKDNMIAVTDYWCQEGDEVFMFPGTDTPFVLRKQLDGDCYRLVGPAMVDRLLRVGYQEWRSEGDDLQDIVLI